MVEMKKNNIISYIFAISLIFMANTCILLADNNSDDNDFIFESPRPLIDDKFTSPVFYNNWGIDLSLSGSGFAFGTIFNFGISENIQITTSILFSGARNTDELEYWDNIKGEYRVPDKLNRLFKIPISFGLKYFVLTDLLGESFKPYVCAAASPTLIISTPYDREFFNATHYGITYLRMGGFAGIGSDFGIGKSLVSLNFRYYLVPFGGDGLYSVRNSAITDFGGFYIGVAFGTKF